MKLSQKVSELNARKFNKWRHEPKIVDIQREFHNVDLITKRGRELLFIVGVAFHIKQHQAEVKQIFESILHRFTYLIPLYLYLLICSD